MRCYACGNELTEHNYCTACGADVGDYKTIMMLSNRLYNEGLDKARVRDLSGAVRCLRQSIKLNKANIDARNLLGLIYYETGEVVAALTEWVISKNFQDEKNLAGDLLANVQHEKQRLEMLGQTATKFNIALNRARDESFDVAVVQLKRILQLNPNFLRARELLALLYLRAGEYERARLECNRCLRIDTGNTTAKRYLKEAQAALTPTDGGRRVRKNKNDDVIRYQSGNETIIQPSRPVYGGALSVGAAVLGVAVGIAVAWFLILPTRVSRVQQASRQEITSISEESDAKSVQLKNKDQEIAKLNEQIAELEAQAREETDDGTAGALLRAVTAYLNDPEDMETIRQMTDEIDFDAPEITENEDNRKLLKSYTALVGKSLAAQYYEEGYDAFRAENDTQAIERLKKASIMDEEHEEALYYLGRACYRSGDIENARTAFEAVVSRFPDTPLATEAQNALAEINNPGA